jgi:hypothetical protein
MPITSGEIQQNLKNLKPEQLQKLQRFLTPGFATVAGVLFGDDVGDFLNSIANPAMQLVPVPVKAIQFLGEDKVNKFFQKAAENADLVEQEQMAAQPQQGGFAAPQQAQQQAPESPPAPTGFSNRPQLPLPTTSNALSVDNQPIQ